MPKRKASSNGYYELKSDLYSDIKLERRRLDYDMPMHFHRNLEFQYIESGEYRTVIDGTVDRVKDDKTGLNIFRF